MPPVIINAEIARRRSTPVHQADLDGLPARLPRRRLDFEFNYRTGSTGCTGAQLVARCRHLRKRTPRPNHSQNVTMFELLKMNSLPMSYFTAQNHVHPIKLRSIQITLNQFDFAINSAFRKIFCMNSNDLIDKRL